MADSLSVIAGMALGPTPHLSYNRLKAFTALGKRVLHFRRNNFVDLPANQPVCLQLAKLLGQHLLTSVADQLPELAEKKARIRLDIIEQQRFVFPAHYRQRDDHGAKNRSVGGLARSRFTFGLQFND